MLRALLAALILTASPAMAKDVFVDADVSVVAQWIDGRLHVKSTSDDGKWYQITCDVHSWPSNTPNGILQCGKRKIHFSAPNLDEMTFGGVKLVNWHCDPTDPADSANGEGCD